MTKVLSIDIGLSNYSLCALELPSIQVTTLELWNLGDSKVVPASQLIDRLLGKIQAWELWKTWTPDTVLIEQQIRGAHINLALAFSTYTAMKMKFPGALVKFVTPMAKFKGYQSYLTLAEAKADIPKDYTGRKRHSVYLAKKILQQTFQDHWLESRAKLDDLADSFLQAFCC